MTGPRVLYYRSMLGLFILYPLIKISKADCYPVDVNLFKALLVRGFFGFLTNATMFTGVKYLNLSEAIII